MTFSSIPFIYAFLPVSLIIYYLTPRKGKNTVLLILSIIFCAMSGLGCLAFISLYTVWNYLIGILCGFLKKRKSLMIISAAVGILADVAFVLLLCYEIIPINEITGKILSYVIPLGAPFLLITAIGYILDICRGKIELERNIMNFALYLIFFPKLLMGPIISYKRFSRMAAERNSDLADVGAGLSLFVIGLAKKILLADNAYKLYSAVGIMDISELSSLSVWLEIISFMFCLYFTLSGFSDMAVGIARCFGFRLPQSFHYPSKSAGINDFCTRWHMPVVFWFNKNVYKPVMKIANFSAARYILPILIWALIGIWYKLSLNTLIWGALIGASAVLEELLKRKKILKATAVIYTLILISLFSVFLLGDNLSYSLNCFLVLVGGNGKIVDTVSLYLLKSYAIILLVCVFASTDLYKRLMSSVKNKAIKLGIDIASPIVLAGLLFFCTVEISYTGASEIMLPILWEAA